MTAIQYTNRRSHVRICDMVMIAYAASVPYDIFATVGSRSVTSLLKILLLGTWIADLHRGHRVARFHGDIAVLLWLYCMWALTTMFWSSTPPSSRLSVGAALLLNAALLPVLVDALTRVGRKVFVALGLGASGLAILIMTQPRTAETGGRVRIAGVDENVTALVLAVGFGALLYLLPRSSRRAYLPVAGLVLVIGAAILRTGSRTGVVAVVALLATAVFLALKDRQRPFYWIKVLACAVSGYFVLDAVQHAGQVPPRLLAFFNQTTIIDPARSDIVDLYLRTMDRWVIWGVGYGGDAAYLEKTQGTYANAHSLFWKLWVESGAVGLLLFGAVLFLIGRRAFRTRSTAAFLHLVVPLAAFAVSLGAAGTAVFWLVLAFGISATTVETDLCMPRRLGLHPTDIAARCFEGQGPATSRTPDLL
jgi:O-antigen ligase